MRRLLALFSCLVPISAQTTWTVDAMNGPGSNFADLPSAIAASAPGDVIQLRSYPPTVAIYQAAAVPHGLTIVGVGGRAALQGRMDAIDLGPSEHLILRSLHTGPYPNVTGNGNGPTGTLFQLYVVNCASVHLQDLQHGEGFTNGLAFWMFTECDLVTLSGCSYRSASWWHSIRLRDCELVVMQNTTTAKLTPQTLAVRATRTHLTLVDSHLFGMLNGPWGPGVHAIELNDSKLDLIGASSVVGEPEATRTHGSNLFRIGPNANMGATGGTVVYEALTGMSAEIDGNQLLEIDVHGAANGIGILSFGTPTQTPVPLWGATYFLSAPTVTVFATTLLDGHGVGTWQTTLPAGVPTGTSLWLQTAVLDGNGAFALTTPAVVTTP
ncbi:MAG: hypothetical protein AB8H80_09805 [Planctomycetota bacterium]